MKCLLISFLFGIAYSSPVVNRTCTADEGKLECGYYGINEEQCVSRRCCWTPCEDCDDPWCHLSSEMMPLECATSLEDRVECGFFGIERDQCLRKKCCWQPYGVDSKEPWCFHPRELPQVPPTEPEVEKKEKGNQQWWQEVLKKTEKLSAYSKKGNI